MPDPPPGPLRTQLVAANETRVRAAQDALRSVLDSHLDRSLSTILARVRGPKARKGTRWWVTEVKEDDRPQRSFRTTVLDHPHETELKSIDPDYVVPVKITDGLEDDLRPVALRIATDAASDAAHRLGSEDDEDLGDFDLGEIEQAVDEVVGRILGVAERHAREVRAAVLDADRTSEDIDEVLDRIEAAHRKGGNWLLMSGNTLANALVNDAALREAIRRGVTHIQWLSRRDGRVRPTHVEADGQVRRTGDHFRVGHFHLLHPGDPADLPDSWPEVANCFVGETVVNAPDVEGSFKIEYTGEIVKIRTGSGRILAGTPNHPVLTERGWVALGQLDERDHVICADRGDNRLTRVDPDMKYKPAHIEQVHRALTANGTSQRISGCGVNFHGDRPTGNVEVVATNGMLDLRANPSFNEKRDQGILMRRGPSVSLTANGDGAPGAFSVGDDASTSSAVRGGGETDPLLRTEALHAEHVRGASTAWLHAGAQQAASDGGPVDTEAFRQRLLAFSGGVAADEIVDIERSTFTGHVYDLQTSGGTYTASGIVVHNCRCGLRFRKPEKRTQATLDLIFGHEPESGDGIDEKLRAAAIEAAAVPETEVLIPAPEGMGLPPVASVVTLDEPVVGFRVLDRALDVVPGQRINLPGALTLGLAAATSTAVTLTVVIPAGVAVGYAAGAVILPEGAVLEILGAGAEGVSAIVLETTKPQ